jgi:hypothetical protein
MATEKKKREVNPVSEMENWKVQPPCARVRRTRVRAMPRSFCARVRFGTGAWKRLLRRPRWRTGCLHQGDWHVQKL